MSFSTSVGSCERASYFTVACSNYHILDREILQKCISVIILLWIPVEKALARFFDNQA